jgi:hypothetical protein
MMSSAVNGVIVRRANSISAFQDTSGTTLVGSMNSNNQLVANSGTQGGMFYIGIYIGGGLNTWGGLVAIRSVYVDPGFNVGAPNALISPINRTATQHAGYMNLPVNLGAGRNLTVGGYYIGNGHGISNGFHSGHRAIDFGWGHTADGSESPIRRPQIYAAYSGTVRAVQSGMAEGTPNCLGNFVLIEHRIKSTGAGLLPMADRSIYTLYAHLHSITHIVRNPNRPQDASMLRPGDPITAGQAIGVMGRTGTYSTTQSGPLAGVHLHFEIYIAERELGFIGRPTSSSQVVLTSPESAIRGWLNPLDFFSPFEFYSNMSGEAGTIRQPPFILERW